MIKTLLNKIKKRKGHNGTTLYMTVDIGFTEKELLERLLKAINEISINYRFVKYELFAREFARDKLLIDLIDERLKELEEVE